MYADGGSGTIKVDSGYKTTAGVGFTTAGLHLSEIDKWRASKDSLARLIPARPRVKGAMMVVESTAEGKDMMYDLWQTDNPALLKIFIGWLIDEKCRVAITAEQRRHIESTLDEDEVELMKIGADFENLEFRRQQLMWMSKSLFCQEYPATPEQAFQFSEQGFFSGDTIQALSDDVEKWKNDEKAQKLYKRGEVVIHKDAVSPWAYTSGWRGGVTGSCHMFKPPINGHGYMLGCDPAEGIEISVDGRDRDNTVIQVWDYESYEQVFEYCGRIS